jgi:O-glycosyl hydrolase
MPARIRRDAGKYSRQKGACADMKKILCVILALAAAFSVSCSSGRTDAAADSTENTAAADTVASADTTAKAEEELDMQLTLTDVKTVRIDTTERYQTVESFGASGAWWAQNVGGWTDKMSGGTETREYIARLLYDPVEGIGLTCFRYNIGAGSANGRAGDISDPCRRAETFEVSPGEYDWERDKNAVWFMRRAVELGADEIVMFVNSPPVRLTASGLAHAKKNQSDKSNLPRENYGEFAKVTLDIVEHFVSEGLPVKFVSPINEPQWDWDGGQEGCHYDADEAVDVLAAFAGELSSRPALADVELSAPEGGEWKNATLTLCSRILKDERLAGVIKTLDNHSYWSDADDKRSFARFMEARFPGVGLRCSEWCEMVNGRDMTMDSALNLALCIHEDMTILNCASWQYWIAVSCYDYRDGLIYVSMNTHKVSVPKRLWAMGNYSRYIKRGYVRVGCSLDAAGVSSSAYLGPDGLVAVFVNTGAIDANIDFSGVPSEYSRVSVIVTDKTRDLERTYYGELLPTTAVVVPRCSVTTVVLN